MRVSLLLYCIAWKMLKNKLKIYSITIILPLHSTWQSKVHLKEIFTYSKITPPISDELIWQKAWSTKFPCAPTHSYPTLASWVIKRLNNRITGRWTDIASGRFDLEWKVSVYCLWEVFCNDLVWDVLNVIENLFCY